MRLSILFAAGLLGMALCGSAAHALTYDSHVSRDSAGTANLLGPDGDSDGTPSEGSLQVRFGGGSTDESSAGADSQFLNSTDHNFSPPNASLPFGGMIEGQNDR